jgi:hypothetical protein
MITNQDFEIPEADTRSVSIPLKTRDASGNELPYTVPPGGIVYWWASRSMHDGTSALVKKSSPATIILTLVGGGTTMTILMSSADTLGRAWQNLYHEGYVVQADGVKVRLFSGTMKVSKTLVS